MPKYPANNMSEFMNRVRQSNSHFRESASSLRPLIMLLRVDSQSSQIVTAIAAIRKEKQDRYKSALDHVRATFPGLKGQGMLGVQLANHAFKTQQDREARVQTQYKQANIQQTQNGKAFSWNVKLTFADYSQSIVVKPVIRYRAKPGLQGHNPTSDELNAWKTQIEVAWRAKFQVGDTIKDVMFEIQFVDWNAAAGNQAYKIDVVNIPIEEAQEKELISQGLMAPGGKLQNQDWRVKQEAKNLLLDGSSLGTPNLGQWGVQDRQAILHEFGHAIGNPDEYEVTDHNVKYGGHLGSYNFAPFSTDSIMNDTAKAQIYKRHFAVVYKLYVEWLAANGPAQRVSIIEPKA